MPSGKFQNLPAIAGGILVFLAALSIYLATIAPTLSWRRDQMGVEGGDLLAAVETLGIPHPSGYPTYVIALKLFATVVPVGDLLHCAVRGAVQRLPQPGGGGGLLLAHRRVVGEREAEAHAGRVHRCCGHA